MSARFLCASLGFAAFTASGRAGADDQPRRPIDAEVTADTAAQLYEMRSPSGQTVIGRRRLTTTIGASAYNLLDKPLDPMAPTLTFRARLRYDADYGGSAEETSLNRLDRFVPGFYRGPVDLMYGYVEGRRFLRGFLNFRVGRQYVTDALGWWSFDGGQVQVTTPYYFAVEAYGGLEQRGGFPFNTPRYERDGIWRGRTNDYDNNPNVYPSFQPNNLAPAFGAAVETAGFTWLHGRATYRRVYNTGGSNASPFANGLRQPIGYDGARISQERVGYAVDGMLPELGGFKAGFAYDLYVQRMANVFASVDWYTSKKVTLSLDYDFYQPTFDGDSIFNFFMAMPMNDVAFRAAWDPSSRLSVAGNLHARLFTVATGPEEGINNTSPGGLALANYYPSSAVSPVGGANLSGRYRIGEGMLGARGAADVATSGDRVGLDVYGERTLETRFVFQGRLGVWQWNDKLRPDRDATDLGYAVAAGYKFLPRSLVLADFQHDMNRLAGQRFRAMLWFSIALSLSGKDR
ncbi:MAG: hypothetical protein KIT84_33230 [Labilithrix sp.]|nr:hypothetical protein [Labilithrix sp.]MCW5815910.1 hypothetical protein [Labilithrix sp.]